MNQSGFNLSVRVRCFLLGINRSNIYYKSRDNKEVGDLCNLIYELWQQYQFFGYRLITAILRDQNNLEINHKKTLRLMKIMGIKALYPGKKKRTTFIQKADYKYPYLLKENVINKPNQVWATDIT